MLIVESVLPPLVHQVPHFQKDKDDNSSHTGIRWRSAKVEAHFLMECMPTLPAVMAAKARNLAQRKAFLVTCLEWAARDASGAGLSASSSAHPKRERLTAKERWGRKGGSPSSNQQVMTKIADSAKIESLTEALNAVGGKRTGGVGSVIV